MPYRSTRPATIRRRAEVGDRIRSLRRWRNLSQETLGNLVGIDRRSLMSIENGRAGLSIDALYDIADALRVPVVWFFSDDWTRPPGDPGDVPRPNPGDTLPPH